MTTPAPVMQRFRCPARVHPDFAVSGGGPQTCPWCEANELRVDLAELRGVKAEREQALGRVGELTQALEQVQRRAGDPVAIARAVLARGRR